MLTVTNIRVDAPRTAAGKGGCMLDFTGSLTLEKGAHCLLIGPSGCGKTTLMAVMGGLMRAQRGDVVFDGASYAGLSARALDALRVRAFSFVFQRLHLIGHLTAAQNVALAASGAGLRADEARVAALLEAVGLAGKHNQKAQSLSQGEAQRVAIARAMMNNPQVIFADEPTSALDDRHTDIVMDLLFSMALAQGASLVVATHDARIKNRFSHVVEMGQNKMEQDKGQEAPQ